MEEQRQISSFDNMVSQDAGAKFPAESGRYQLYISFGCPFAHRCYMLFKLKGLEDTIGLTVTKSSFTKTREDPGDSHIGWAFPSNEEEEPGALPDYANGAKFIRDLYDLASSNSNVKYTGSYSVPVLWDKKTKTIVNNESPDIMKIFNFAFNDFAKFPAVNLYPPHLSSQMEEVDGLIRKSICETIYRVGFATKQESYDEAVAELFNSLDKCEEILSKQRYMAGDTLTVPDILLFPVLIRFDEAYFGLFKCSKKLIREYSNLFNYTKDVFQIPAITTTVDFVHMRKFYYTAAPTLNQYKIIPVGPSMDYSTQHDRDRFN